MENIIISNQKRFEELRENLRRDGLDKLHILADFDRTLTQTFVNGKRIASLISVLRDGGYLTKDYPEKAKALYEKYYTIEIDLSLPREQKKEAMEQWWTEHFRLLIESNLNIKDIEKAMESSNIVLREGVPEFLKNLDENNIPLIILSSSGIGKEAIELCLERRDLLLNNIQIISNSFEWDENGKAIKPNEPIIHTLNKDQTSIESFPEIFKKVKDRRNVILLGDNISDIEMIAGFKHNNLIKIGFLNEKVEENLERYKEAFDVVITNDSSIEFLNNFLRQLK